MAALNLEVNWLASLKGTGKLGDSTLRCPGQKGGCHGDAACESVSVFSLVGGAGADLLAAATDVHG